MENEQKNEQMKNAVDKIQGFGKNTFSAENYEKARALSDAFMFKVYRCAKYVMSLLAAICLVVAICSAVFAILRRSSGINVPEFENFKYSYETESSNGNEKSDLSGIKDARQIEKKYGDIIQSCVEKMELSEKDAKNEYDSIKKTIGRLDEEERGGYIKGLRSFISDAASYSKTNEKAKKDLSGLADTYEEEYFKAKQEAIERAEAASASRLASWCVFGFSLLFLLVSLFLPLLLQIEENTRKSAN